MLRSPLLLAPCPPTRLLTRVQIRRFFGCHNLPVSLNVTKSLVRTSFQFQTIPKRACCCVRGRGRAARFLALSRTTGTVLPERTPFLPLQCSAKASPANLLLLSVFKRPTKKFGDCRKNSSVRAPPLHQASFNRPRQHHATRPRTHCAKVTKASRILSAATHCARQSSSPPPSQVLPRTPRFRGRQPARVPHADGTLRYVPKH